MPYASSYHLTAYDHETGVMVFDWPVVVEIHRWVKGEIIEDGTRRFRVEGVFDNSTANDWRIGVTEL